jgi:hypothetical protein
MIRGLVVACAVLMASCGSSSPGQPGGTCTLPCGLDQVCRYETCIAAPTACTVNADCRGDAYCDTAAKECVPWDIGPGGSSDRGCHSDPLPGVFFPGVQCQWLGPPEGDGFPTHKNVLATPMVAAFENQGEPAIAFTSYNFTDQQGGDSCSGTSTQHFGVIRIIDGRTCAQLATIATPSVIGSAALAVADLGGDDATPEIVAARSQGGLVAFTHRAAGWVVLWETQPPYPVTPCDWAGPSIHDLDDDGLPEVIFYGAVYNGQTGATLDDSKVGTVDSTAVGYIPVVADVDGDGIPELVTGTELYSWDRSSHSWLAKRALPAANGLVAVGDFGTFPATGQDDRAHTDGIAELVVVYNDVVHLFTVAGREVFTAQLVGHGGPATGGPPIVGDFDGDGRVEIGVATTSAYNVLDPDCLGIPDPATCGSMSTTGVLWTVASQGRGSDHMASSAFDFDGDGRPEIAHSDECFARIYDGRTGAVLSSHPRSSCTWMENPVIADTDGDYRAELVISSNTNCGTTSVCPAIDPLFDGVLCSDDSDCPSRSATAMSCARDGSGGGLGRCRCRADADCGDGYACSDPIAGASPAGRVCRASHPATATSGIEVLADAIDRWTAARPIWNQHAYSITNVDQSGRVPRTSQWLRNWTQAGLNNFRENAHGDGAVASARPDLTVKRAKVSCDAAAPTISAEICNRGSMPVGPGVPVAVYASTTPTRLRCQAQTAVALAPGSCTAVSCAWIGPSGDGAIAVDDRGDGLGVARECREDNNLLAVHVACPGAIP